MDTNALVLALSMVVGGTLILGIPWRHRHAFSQVPTHFGSHAGWVDQPVQALRVQLTSQSPSSTSQHPDAAPLSKLVWAHHGAAAQDGIGCPFPLLTSLDLARGPGQEPFATSPNAALLEAQARVLADQYWSEVIWLTGWVDQERLAVVCTELGRQQQAGTATSPAKNPSPPFFAL